MISSTQKNLLLEQFKKTPVVQVACEKTNIARATYYRWRKEDLAFADAADLALSEGSLLINDLAESQLICAIKEKNISAITFWLKSHHRGYAPTVEVNGKLDIESQVLTPEQEELIKNALHLAGLTPQDVL